LSFRDHCAPLLHLTQSGRKPGRRALRRAATQMDVKTIAEIKVVASRKAAR